MRSVSVSIRSDAAIVWRWLAVPELMNRWMHSIENLRTTDGASISEGAVLRFIARGREHTTTVTEYIPERALNLCSTQGPITANYRYLLESENAGCRLTLTIDCRARGIAKLVGPLIGLMAWYTDKGQVDRLKVLAEFSTENIDA